MTKRYSLFLLKNKCQMLSFKAKPQSSTQVGLNTAFLTSVHLNIRHPQLARQRGAPFRSLSGGVVVIFLMSRFCSVNLGIFRFIFFFLILENREHKKK